MTIVHPTEFAVGDVFDGVGCPTIFVIVADLGDGQYRLEEQDRHGNTIGEAKVVSEDALLSLAARSRFWHIPADYGTPEYCARAKSRLQSALAENLAAVIAEAQSKQEVPLTVTIATPNPTRPRRRG